MTASIVGVGVRSAGTVTRILCRASELGLALATWYRGDASMTLHFEEDDLGRVARELHREVITSG